jgi:hypothetical protein
MRVMSAENGISKMSSKDFNGDTTEEPPDVTEDVTVHVGTEGGSREWATVLSAQQVQSNL